MTEQYPFPAESYILVGRVSKGHGLKGELKIVSTSGDPEDYNNYSRAALVAGDGRMTALLNITRARIQGRQIILKLETIDSKSEADLTVGMGVLIAREDLADNGLSHQLLRHEGKTVKTVAGRRIIGVVQSCFDNGAHQILVVRSGDEEILIPLINEFLIHIDEREIIIDPPPGLLDINATGSH